MEIMAREGIMRIFKIAAIVWSIIHLIGIAIVTIVSNMGPSYIPWYEIAVIDAAFVLHAALWIAIAYGIIRLAMYFIDYSNGK